MADTSRKSTSMPTRPPSRSTWRCSSTRSSLACDTRARSPISSRNSVPWSASSTRPIRRSWAPVNAPCSWPNTSASNSESGTAAQLTAWNALRLPPAQVVDGPRRHFLAGAGRARGSAPRCRSWRRCGSIRARAASSRRARPVRAASGPTPAPRATAVGRGRGQELGQQARGRRVRRPRGAKAVPAGLASAGPRRRSPAPRGSARRRRACTRARPSASRVRTSRSRPRVQEAQQFGPQRRGDERLEPLGRRRDLAVVGRERWTASGRLEDIGTDRPALHPFLSAAPVNASVLGGKLELEGPETPGLVEVERLADRRPARPVGVRGLVAALERVAAPSLAGDRAERRRNTAP